MKKLLQIITAVLIGSASIGGLASADTCDNISITGTGPGSSNSIDCTDITDITYTCTNGVLTLNYTNQDGSTGDATVDFNTDAGAAVSGTVTNDNNTTTDLSTACGPVAAPVTPGKGSLNPGGGMGAFMPTVLPYTGDMPVLPIIIGSLVAAAGIVVASRIAMAIVRHRNLK